MIGGRDKDVIGTEQIIAEEMSTGDQQMKSILLIMEEKGLNMNILQVEHHVALTFSVCCCQYFRIHVLEPEELG